MMRLRIFLALLLLTGLVSAFGGYLFGNLAGNTSYASSFEAFVGASYVDAAIHADRDVSNLTLLRNGDVSAAVNALEHDLDGNLATLADYHEITPRQARRKAVYDLLDRIRSYRAAYPSDLAPGPKHDAVLRALALVPDSSASRP